MQVSPKEREGLEELVTAAGVNRGGDQERGAIAVLTALAMVAMLIAVAFAVDVGRWYVEGQRLQRAADAAALAGVPYMPGDFAEAKVQARKIVVANGYVSSDTPSGNVVAIEGTSKPSELRVKMTSKIPNIFASVIGLGWQSLTRSATADYTGPAPMGSPCNTFGNAPAGSSATSGVGPTGTTQPDPKFANCSDSPNFWGSVYGPLVYKTQGDRYGTRRCMNFYNNGQGVDVRTAESGCVDDGTPSGTPKSNAEFKSEGYVIVLKFLEDVGPVKLQLYDPAYVDSGGKCEDLPSSMAGVSNDYTTGGDASDRYRDSDNAFCSGDGDNRSWSDSAVANDELNDSQGEEIPTVTSFGLLSDPGSTYDPFSTSANSNPVATCSRQFPGYSKKDGKDGIWVAGPGGSTGSGASATAQLKNTSNLTEVFHQWVTLCTFDPSKGDYYLRIRTNVALGNDFRQIGDDLTVQGNGGNRFGIRVLDSGTGKGTKLMSVSAYERMPIYMNVPNTLPAEFNLLRVPQGAAGQNMKVSFFDVGDAAGGSGATLTVLPPTDGNIPLPPGIAGCKGVKGDSGSEESLTGCSKSGIQNNAGWNGQSYSMTVPIPETYTCSDVISGVTNQGGCWFRLRVSFNGGSITDQTTWTASLDGDPVRLVQ